MKVIIITGDEIDNLIIFSRKFNDPSLIDEYAKLFDFYLIDINNKIDIFSIKIIIGIMDIIMFGQLLLWKKLNWNFSEKLSNKAIQLSNTIYHWHWHLVRQTFLNCFRDLDFVNLKISSSLFFCCCCSTFYSWTN